MREDREAAGRQSDAAAELARLGYVNERGVAFSASSIKSMLDA